MRENNNFPEELSANDPMHARLGQLVSHQILDNGTRREIPVGRLPWKIFISNKRDVLENMGLLINWTCVFM